jgi:hypothetical protein
VLLVQRAVSFDRAGYLEQARMAARKIGHGT